MKIMVDIFEKQLQNVYNSELLILDALPQMLTYVTNRRLSEIIKFHINETYMQKVRLEEIGTYLNMKMAKTDGKIILGLLEEMEEFYEEFQLGVLMDVGITSKLQHIQHFQISAYETALLYAKSLKLDEVADILFTTLEEAYEADEVCSNLAKDLLLV